MTISGAIVGMPALRKNGTTSLYAYAAASFKGDLWLPMHLNFIAV